jgi:HSP20 family protein
MQFPITLRPLNPTVNDVFTLRREMDRWLEGPFGSSQSLQAWAPAVSIQETENEVLVTAELAGINPSDVEVTVENGVLTISGEKKPAGAELGNAGPYHLNERRYGRFERSFTLLQSVLPDDIAADFTNGVLTITLPKTAEAKPRRIRINASERAPALERPTATR